MILHNLPDEADQHPALEFPGEGADVVPAAMWSAHRKANAPGPVEARRLLHMLRSGDVKAEKRERGK